MGYSAWRCKELGTTERLTHTFSYFKSRASVKDRKWDMMGGPQNKSFPRVRFGATVFEMVLLAEMGITLGDSGILGLFPRKKIRNSVSDTLSLRCLLDIHVETASEQA